MTSETKLTNAHTHLELTGVSNLCPSEPVPFLSWLRRMSWNRYRLLPTRLVHGVREGIREMKRCGTTQVADVSATGASVALLMKSGLEGVVYMEVLGLEPKKALRRLEQIQTYILHLRKHPGHGTMRVGLFLHAPYSCHPELLRKGATWCRWKGVPLGLHVAESPEETEFLLTGQVPSASSLFKFIAKLRRSWPAQFPGMRPIPYLDSLGVLDARPTLVHAVNVTDEEIELIARKGCAVVHCPRSNHLLSCGRMPLEKFLQAGVAVRLGTDSLASSPDLDIRNEAAFAKNLHQGLVDPEAIEQMIHQPLEIE